MSERVMHTIEDGRFEFGANWSRYLEVLNDTRIQHAEASLKQMLKVATLRDRTFLDIGSGSGLFSLAARRLGAQVCSFDYDPESVACAVELKHRYFPDDGNWTIEQGSVLDEKYVRSLGTFDVVYSWGVLHHTGAMRQALGNAQVPVAPGGRLFIAIYNDQGRPSLYWKKSEEPVQSTAEGAEISDPWPRFPTSLGTNDHTRLPPWSTISHVAQLLPQSWDVSMAGRC
jgi:2-polyprenyl-6-hydroxyphenyl methylase/3-demethylubiquinone-9 3-methyltransferase